MADLSSILMKTINGLPRNTPTIRAKVYEKARAAIERQMNDAHPKLSDNIVTTRREALERAINLSEAYYLSEEQSPLSYVPEEEIAGPGYGFQSREILLSVEEQTPNVVVFSEAPSGKIDADLRSGAESILTDGDAVDRFNEMVWAAERLLNGFDPTAVGGNAGNQLIEIVQRFRDALGDAPQQVRPGLLIPRGEAIRLYSEAQDSLTDEMSDTPPLSQEMRGALRLLVSSYNVFVALDPFLSERDEARLGPDATRYLIAPEDGAPQVREVLRLGIITESSATLMEEEAHVAPQVPSSESRKSRRFSEVMKNLVRAILAKVWKVANAVTVGGIVVTSVSIGTVALTAARWSIANEQWLLQTFAKNPYMLETVTDIIRVLRSLPLL